VVLRVYVASLFSLQVEMDEDWQVIPHITHEVRITHAP